MLGNVELRFVTPQDDRELAAHRAELEFLFRFIPVSLTREQVWDFCASQCPNVTLVYANGVLIGSFIMEVFNDSVELHGVVRPDISAIVPRANRVKLHIYDIIFDAVFNTMDRKRVVVKAPDTNRDVFGFAVMYGFRRLKYLDKGERVYVLDRSTYLQRMDNGKRTEESIC